MGSLGMATCTVGVQALSNERASSVQLSNLVGISYPEFWSIQCVASRARTACFTSAATISELPEFELNQLANINLPFECVSDSSP